MDDRTRMLLKESFWRWMRSASLIFITFVLIIYYLFVAGEKPETGFLRVQSIPPGIPIILDGGSTQYYTDAVIPNVKVGTRMVTLSHTDWIITPEFQAVTVKKKDTVTVLFHAESRPIEPKPIIPTEKGVPAAEPRYIDSTISRKEPPPPVRSKTKARGAIQVSSNISGASIAVNDIETGQLTPSVINELQAGSYRITIVKTGYSSIPDVATITVDPDFGMSTVHFELVPKNAQQASNVISIVTFPPRQYVTLNGDKYGPTPIHLVLPIGTYRAVFSSCSGYDTPAPQQFVLTRTDSASIRAEYKKMRGEALFAIVIPRGADQLDVGKLRVEIDNLPFFNGSNTEASTILWNHFPEGDHHITVYYDNLSVETDATFTLSQVTPVELRFDRVFSQIKPRLRVLEPEPQQSFRKHYGKIISFD